MEVLRLALAGVHLVGDRCECFSCHLFIAFCARLAADRRHSGAVIPNRRHCPVHAASFDPPCSCVRFPPLIPRPQINVDGPSRGVRARNAALIVYSAVAAVAIGAGWKWRRPLLSVLVRATPVLLHFMCVCTVISHFDHFCDPAGRVHPHVADRLCTVCLAIGTAPPFLACGGDLSLS